MNKIEFIENIPQIPEELLLYNIDDITSRENMFGLKKANDVYSTHDAPIELYDFLRPHFESNIQIRYQVIKKQLPIHIDAHAKNVSHVFNYGLLTGGDSVKTRWWKMPKEKQLVFDGRAVDICMGDEQSPYRLLQEIIIPPKRWHRLQVDIPHDISKIDTPRLGITVFENK